MRKIAAKKSRDNARSDIGAGRNKGRKNKPLKNKQSKADTVPGVAWEQARARAHREVGSEFQA